jgi:hypothetical protein
MDEHQLTNKLAWFSVAIGLTEIVAPKTLARTLGVTRGHRLIQLFGLRELAAGVGLLTQNRRAPWLWARVAGDALDIGALATALAVSNKRGAVAAALSGVLAVTAADVVCAGQLSREGR